MIYDNQQNAFKGIAVKHKIVNTLYDMVNMHSHIYYELYFLNTGKRRHFIHDSVYDVVPGNLVLIPKGILHRTTSIDYNAGFDRYGANFGENIVDALKRHVDESLVDHFMNNSHCLVLPEDTVNYVRRQFQVMLSEKETNDIYSSILMENALLNLLLAAMRHGKSKAHKQTENRDQMQRALRYINENYDKNITLRDTAKMFLMEETYFSKKFKQMTGYGFKEFLIHTRIDKAKDLLTNCTWLEIRVVAEKCGFSGTNYFGDAFKKITGMSPRAYRKMF